MTDADEPPDLPQDQRPTTPDPVGKPTGSGDARPNKEGQTRHAPVTSVAAALPLQLPWLLWSGLLVWSIAVAIVDMPWGLVVLAVWLASGVVVLWSPVEDVIAKAMFRLRRPTMAEQRRFDIVWERIATTAGIEGSTRSLWVEESDAVTSTAPGGRAVGATRWALTVLTPDQLAAVLAHELAHHLAGRSWVSLLGVWYSLPARGMVLLIRALLRLTVGVKIIGCLLAGFLIPAFVGMLIMVIFLGDSFLLPLVMLTPLFAPPILAWFSRLAEKHADKVAADLGYGPALIQVMYGWQARNEAARPQGTRRSEILARQPSAADRIRSLELYIQAQQV